MKQENIASIGPAYAGQLARLNQQLIADEGHANPMSVAELTERMLAWLSADYQCIGIFRANDIAAYCLYRDDANEYYIRQLFTCRACRGQGLATALLTYLEKQLLMVKPIRLEVLSGNEAAARFYAARGYQVYSHTLVKRA